MARKKSELIEAPVSDIIEMTEAPGTDIIEKEEELKGCRGAVLSCSRDN